MVLYEAPHHLIQTLEDLYRVLENRSISICRELTKRHEEMKKTTLADALSFYREQEPRGEYVLVVEGKSYASIRREQQAGWEAMTLEAHMAYYEDQGIAHKEAMRLVAKDRGVSRRDVYRQLLGEN